MAQQHTAYLDEVEEIIAEYGFGSMPYANAADALQKLGFWAYEIVLILEKNDEDE